MVENQSASCRLQAAAVIVSSQQMIAPGQIVIRQGRIVEVTHRLSETPDVRLDDGVLLPGLINPHTHLEFSDLARPLPAGAHFPDWIQNVLTQRQQATSPDARAASIHAGLRESQAAGVVALGDIATPPWHPTMLLSSRMDDLGKHRLVHEGLDENSVALLRTHLMDTGSLPKVVAFIEQLGLSPQRRQSLTDWREQILNVDSESWPDQLQELALSPHAPYSTPLELIQELSQLARLKQHQLAMHLLESPAERQWLDEGSGPMADMLTQFGMPGWRLPSDYIQQLCSALSQARSTLLIHGNYLNDSELDCIANHANFSIVYCPRTHAHFGHRDYPLQALEQRGIRWLLGTDSRSTNPDLNLWKEVGTAIDLHSWLRPSQAFSAVTDRAALAMQLEQEFGSLRPGRRAAINCVRLASKAPGELEKMLELLVNDVRGPQLLF